MVLPGSPSDRSHGLPIEPGECRNMDHPKPAGHLVGGTVPHLHLKNSDLQTGTPSLHSSLKNLHPQKPDGVFRRPSSIQKVVMFLLLVLLLFSERKVVSPTRTLPWKSGVSLLKLQHHFTSHDRVGLNRGNLIRLGISC